MTAHMRNLCLFVLTFCLLASAQALAAPAAHSTRVLLTVDDAAAEPDYAAYGAIVLERWPNHRVIRIDTAALPKLLGVPSIRSVQHIDGEPALPAEAVTTKTLGDPTATATPPTWFSGNYSYDAVGNIIAIGTAVSPNGDGKTNSYYYDSVSRLVQASVNNTVNSSEFYQYDSFGNQTQRTRDSISIPLSVSLTNNRVNGATYDAAGNLTNWSATGETYDYDGANMVVSKKATSTAAAEVYLYTADDERVATRRPDTTWHWTVRDFDGKVLREYESASDAATAIWAWDEDYVYRDGMLFAADRPTAQGGRRHFHLDHLGTPRLITGSTGLAIAVHDYYPFGLEQTQFNQEMTNRGYDRPEPMTFTGHERDYTEGTAITSENFVDYMHARYYRAAWGRFLSLDSHAANPALPQSWDRYTYAKDNPLTRFDPDGRADLLATLSTAYHSLADKIDHVSARIEATVPSLPGTMPRVRQAVAAYMTGELRTVSETLRLGSATGTVLGRAHDSYDLGMAASVDIRRASHGILLMTAIVSTLRPGPHAGESIPARGPQRDFTPAERAKMNDIGQATGCHTCGATDPGTRSGNFVLDHQPPNALNPNNDPQQLYPHCIDCSRQQGGEVRQAQKYDEVPKDE